MNVWLAIGTKGDAEAGIDVGDSVNPPYGATAPCRFSDGNTGTVPRLHQSDLQGGHYEGGARHNPATSTISDASNHAARCLRWLGVVSPTRCCDEVHGPEIEL